MKILVLSPSFYLPGQGVRIGGGEISNFLLLEYLARKGHDIHVIAVHGVHSDTESVRGIHVHNVSNKTALIPGNRLTASLMYKSHALAIAENIKPDIILSITSATPVGLELKKRLNIPAGVLLRAENDLTKGNENASYLKNAFRKVTLGHCSDSLLASSDFMIVNSEYMKERYSGKVHNNNIEVIYPPVEDKQRAFRKADGVRNIVSVGTSKRKGFDTVKVLARLMPEIQFHVAGDPGIPSGRHKIEGNLKISGWLDKKSDYMEQADLVLVPSAWNEPFGRIAVEALRYGLGVLVADKGGLPEVVNMEETLIVSSDDPSHWKDRIEMVNRNPGRFITICQNVAKQSSRFTLSEQADRLESVLQHYSNNH